ncbi:uncharacterized protein LOC130803516 isoform X2 [Amaranthus tricolor]|uniref:uncharacterized protein LOC130803516 isoform X2 n=1 Tax=Amaranthus tricolor TaxID=29722 RepID=UPI0025907DEB|nr:uncharacterized protein LOC130803516 isoform X2 [Amaranthus tricolor]
MLKLNFHKKEKKNLHFHENSVFFYFSLPFSVVKFHNLFLSPHLGHHIFLVRVRIMTQGAKKKKRQQKKKNSKDKISEDKIIEKISALWEQERLQECLDFIISLDDEGLKNLKVYSVKVHVLASLRRFEEVLALQKRLEEFGHKTTLALSVWFMFAYANRKQNNILEAYLLYIYVHDQKGAVHVDDEIFKGCLKWIKRLQPKVQPDLDRIAVERANKFLDDERAASSSTKAPASSSTKAATSSTQGCIHPTKAASTPTKAASTSTLVASASTLAIPSLTLDPSPLVVDASSQKMMKFTEDGVIYFEMTQLDEFSYLGVMKIGGSFFPKSYIKIGENSTSDVSIRLKKNSCLLKIEFSMYFHSLSSRVAIVEPVRPVKAFFELKLEDFKSKAMAQTCKKWWEYIKDDFLSIFRGVICGMLAIYSDQKVCSDFEKSLYVTEEGEAKIFHISQEKFTFSQAQKEVYDLLSIIEGVITLIRTRSRPDLETWRKEFELSYELPLELVHFLNSLRVRKICDSIHPMFLIDHPFFWSINHRVSFIQSLKEAIKERLIKKNLFDAEMTRNFRTQNWRIEVSNDMLLSAIYNYKGHDFYDRPIHVINFIHAVFSHANDYQYDTICGKEGGLTLEERESQHANAIIN